MVDMELILPFLHDSFANLEDMSSLSILSDFLKEKEDIRGWLLSIPLAVHMRDHGSDEYSVTGRSFRVPSSFTNLFGKYLLRRVSALFSIGVLWLHYDRWFSPPFYDTYQRNMGVTYDFGYFPAGTTPHLRRNISERRTSITHEQRFKEFLLRMWLYHAGLLSVQDRDYATTTFNALSYRFFRKRNRDNMFKQEYDTTRMLWKRTKAQNALDLGPINSISIIPLLRSPGGNVHMQLFQEMNRSATHGGYIVPITDATQLPGYTNYDRYVATDEFIKSDLVKELTTLEKKYYEASPFFRHVRQGPSVLFY